MIDDIGGCVDFVCGYMMANLCYNSSNASTIGNIEISVEGGVGCELESDKIVRGEIDKRIKKLK